ncbi:MAG TPA: hypothetical protein VMV69_13550 [Pirellulales bacterium]|nr:hypothetical protein [Pirellulales bacterium]
MPAELTVEQRLADLEREVAELKRQLATTLPNNKANWIERITGTFKDDPDFAEIVRLGAEIRRADRPSDVGP